jgi:hypothetical protein
MGMGKIRLHALMGIFVLMFLAGSAGAADAGQKTRAPRAGEEIIVHTDAGGYIHGHLIELSPESLAILTASGRMDLPLATLARIDATHDSLVNGAVIGGLSLGIWCAVVCGQGLDGGSALPVVLANAGLGALVGAAIDAGHKGRTPIYIRTAGRSGSSLQVKFRF